jgi:hypothetical protein
MKQQSALGVHVQAETCDLLAANLQIVLAAEASFDSDGSERINDSSGKVDQQRLW